MGRLLCFSVYAAAVFAVAASCVVGTAVAAVECLKAAALLGWRPMRETRTATSTSSCLYQTVLGSKSSIVGSSLSVCVLTSVAARLGKSHAAAKRGHCWGKFASPLVQTCCGRLSLRRTPTIPLPVLVTARRVLVVRARHLHQSLHQPLRNLRASKAGERNPVLRQQLPWEARRRALGDPLQASAAKRSRRQKQRMLPVGLV